MINDIDKLRSICYPTSDVKMRGEMRGNFPYKRGNLIYTNFTKFIHAMKIHPIRPNLKLIIKHVNLSEFLGVMWVGPALRYHFHL